MKKTRMVGVKLSKKLFTEKEVEMLSHNHNVKNVSVKEITYTDEFKRTFIAEDQKGKFPRAIFDDHGFDINILGLTRIKSAAKRWRAAYRKDGICGLSDSRKDRSGRLTTNELSIEEKYERLEIQINLLKAENELLKKIDMMERGLRRKK